MSNRITTKAGINIFLIALTFPVSRLWHFFGSAKVSYWLQSGFNYPIEEYWYFDFLSDHIIWILVSIVLVRLSRMRLWQEVVCIVFLLFRVYDLLMFLYNFNRTDDYYVASSCVGVTTALVYFFRTKISKLKGLQDYLKRKIQKHELC